MSERVEPVDVSKYEGHTPGPWEAIDTPEAGEVAISNEENSIVLEAACYADAPWLECGSRTDLDLILDAPAILADLIATRKQLEELREEMEDAKQTWIEMQERLE